MAKRKVSTHYGVVIPTDLYAGNFEREMTAYCTGRIGDCEVGDDLVPLFNAAFGLEQCGQDCEEDPFWDSLHWEDQEGCSRPCRIYGQPNYKSVIIFFQDKPTKQQIEVIDQRAKAFSQDPKVVELMRSKSSKPKVVGKLKVVKFECTETVME